MHSGPSFGDRPIRRGSPVGKAAGILALALALGAGFEPGVEELASGVREASEPVVTKRPVFVDVMDLLLDVVLLSPGLAGIGLSGVLLSWISEIRTGGRQ